MLEILLNGIVVIVGNYGSGKTETAVNLSLARKKAGVDVRIADLDLVNPYFRTREARKTLTKSGIEVVLPEEKYMYADLPILIPRIAGMIQEPAGLTILDAGGDDTGVTVLAALNHVFKNKKIAMLQVVNPYRPFTETIKGCIRIKQEIEASSKLTITGLVSNANLIDETTPDIIYKGYDMIRDLSDETGLKVEFITADAGLLPQLEIKRFDCPVLPIFRQLVPPWKKPVVNKEYGS